MLPAPPRQVEGGPGLQVWLGRIVILPHTLMGVGMLGFLVLTAQMSACGESVTGIVRDRSVVTGTKGGPHHMVQVDYQGGGAWHQAKVEVPKAVYEQLGSLPAPADRAAGVGGDEVPTVELRRSALFERVDFPQTSSNWTGWCALPVVLFWWTIVGSFLRELWVRPLQRRRLVRDGVEARGEIISRGPRMGRGGKAAVEVRFADEVGVSHQVKLSMALPDENVLRQGESCTVLYDRERPERAIIYEFGDYRAVAQGF